MTTSNRLANAFADPDLCRGLLDTLAAELDRPLRFMEVCGTHTVSIFRSGLRSLLPAGIEHLSGPGCPVCVTHDREIAACLEVAGREQVCVATFGDLMRVPGPGGVTLKQAQAQGASVEVVYSPLDALTLARNNPGRLIVFLGVGFETTAPTVAATVLMAQKEALNNFTVLSMHKLVPPALDALLTQDATLAEDARAEQGIDAFLLPGHVSTIVGIQPYRSLADRYGKPGVVGGFEPADILQSLLLMLRMRKTHRPDICNQYCRAVDDQGNAHARRILYQVFTEQDALWRGIGPIQGSGLGLREQYAAFDAWKRLSLSLPQVPEISGCKCGDVLKGRISPEHCPLFGKGCTPAKPVGPCMVSTEGSCAAFFKYSVRDPFCSSSTK